MNKPNAHDVYQMVMQACVENGIDAGIAAMIAKRVETRFAAAEKKAT